MSKLRGRFDGPTGDDMQRFSSSLDVDLRMLDEDIDGSRAHTTMLGEVGLLTSMEVASILEGLEQVREEIRSGAWTPDSAHEDVHMAVEARLTELVGPSGMKLHTARSRNDQVATDVRLWLLRRLPALDAALADLIGTLLDRVERDGRVLIPGFTHLQRGQPILLGHHLLAHAWALERDRGRLADALGRVDECPLGACAMAGTPHPIDRARTAELLGFSAPMPNAMDAVAARDHEQEVVAACAILMTHLSRMAEELIIWSTSEFGLVRLGEAYATGSSIMPQKRNPDAPELVRGKAGRVQGALQTLLALVKGLPLAYNRDLQESRAALFDSVETTTESVRIMDGVFATLCFESERYDMALADDFSLATELADLLVERGVPFREAHEVIGHLVRWCEEENRTLASLTEPLAKRFHPQLSGDLAARLDPRAAAERRTSAGGTAWTEIERQVERLRDRLGESC